VQLKGGGFEAAGFEEERAARPWGYGGRRRREANLRVELMMVGGVGFAVCT
jgi:hypothetical protein